MAGLLNGEHLVSVAMSYVFISYARENKDFVVRLDAALEATGAGSWVDWQEIPPSARWMDEIHRAIIGADAFVFVISPDSAASRTCAWEVSSAAENNKRIIPILWLPDETMELPAPIRDRNWILATGSDDFQEAVSKLTEAIRVDLEYVRSHSRLLNRANEWKAGGAEQSLLLRGWDLDEAERWLSKASGREPPPSALQRDYVACGRWTARLGESDVLYRQSLMHSSRGRYQTAAAYLIRAVEVAPKGGAPAAFTTPGQTPDWAADAWFHYRYLDRKRGRLRARLPGQGAAVSCLARSADGHAVLTGGFDGVIRLWNADTGELQRSLTGHAGAVASVAFAPDGETAWSCAEDGQVLVWNLQNGESTPRFPAAIDPATSIVFDGRRVALGLRSGFVVAFEYESGKMLLHEQVHTGAVTALLFAAGDVLLAGSARPVIGEWLGDGSVTTTSLSSGKTGFALPGTLDEVTSIALSADGRRVLRGLQSGVLEVWDLAPVNKVHELAGHDGPIVAAAIGADLNVALTGGEDRTIRVWDLDAGKARRVFDGHLDAVTAIVLDPDGRTALSASLDETVAVWDLETIAEVTTIDTGEASISAIAFSADGARAVTGASDSAIQMWDADTRESLGLLATQATVVTSVAVSRDGTVAVNGTVAGVAFVWDTATRRRRAALRGHDGKVRSVAISPDSARVATASEDKTVRVWNAETGASLIVLTGHSDTVLTVAFHPTGLELVSVSKDATARVWDVSTGREIRRLTLPAGGGAGLAISPDGHTLLTAGLDGSIQVWAYASGELLRTATGHDDVVWSLATSPDGRTALSGSRDKTARLWDIATGTFTRVFVGHTEDVSAVAFAPDGSFGISGGMDGTIRLWQLDGDASKEIKAHGEGVTSLGVSANALLLATGSVDTVMAIWDLATLKPVARLQEGHAAEIQCVAFSADGSAVVSGSKDRTSRVWDVATGVQQNYFFDGGEGVTGAAFVAGGQMVLSASGNRFKEVDDRMAFGAVGGKRIQDEAGRGLVLLWDRHTNFGWPLERHTRSVDCLAVDDEGQRAVSGSSDGSVRLWDLEAGRQLRLLTGHTSAVVCVAISGDRRWTASGGRDGVIRVWDLDHADPPIVFEGHEKGIGEVAFTPDGRRLVSVSGDRTVRAWDLATQQAEVIGRDVNETSVATSVDGAIAVTGSYDGPVRVWDLTTGTLRQTLTGHQGAVWNVAISADGARAFSVLTDKTIRVWDLQSGRTLNVIPTPFDSTVGARFADDGATGMAAFGDGIARAWNLETGELVRSLTDPANPPSNIAIAPNGRWLVSAARRDGALTVWDVAAGTHRPAARGRQGDVLALACSRDGSRALLAGVDGSVRVWDVQSGRQLPSLEGHGAAVTDVAFDGDGRLAVSASMDGTVRVWDMATGQAMQVLVGHTAPVLGVALMPDGRAAVSVAGDSTARLWDVRSGYQIDAIASRGASSVAIDPRGGQAWLGSRGRLSIWHLVDPRTPGTPPDAGTADPTAFQSTIDAIERSIGLRVSPAGRLELV